MEYGLKRVRDFPVSLRFIRELHEHLMKGVRGGYATPGEFRKSQDWIGPPGCTLNEASFVPPPVDEMQKTLDYFEAYLHSENSYPPLVRLALIHYQFEAIHPFLDGNGRIGRLLIALLLVHWELLSLSLLYLRAFFERNRDRCYELPLSVIQKGAWNEWLSFSSKVSMSNPAMKSSVQNNFKTCKLSGVSACSTHGHRQSILELWITFSFSPLLPLPAFARSLR